MKFITDRDALAAAIGGIYVNKKNNAIAILNNVLLTTEGEKVRLLSHCLDYCCETTCPAEIEQGGATTVTAGEIAGLLGSAPRGSQVICEMEGRRLKMRFGRSVYRLGVLPAEDFPKPLACEATDRLNLTTDEALRLFGEPEFATANDNTAAYRQGFYLHNAAGGLVSIATTCGVQLVQVSIEGLPAIKTNVIVPRQAAREIVKAAEAGPIQIEWSESLMVIACGEWRLTTKLIDARFPEYERLISSVQGRQYLRFDRKELLAAIERLTLVATAGIIAVDWKDGGACVELQAGDAGIEVIECQAERMAAGRFKVPPSQFATMLRAVESDLVDIYVDEPGKALQLRIPTRPHYVALQMPSA